MIITKRIYFLVGVPLAMLILSSLLCTFLIWRNNRVTQELIQEIVIKRDLLSSIYQNAGYGGAIHHFKNLVLRRDLQYLRPAQDSYRIAIKYSEEYLNLPNLEEGERKSVTVIRDGLKKYQISIQKAQVLINNGKSTAEIDDIVKQDDRPVIAEEKNLRDILEQRQKSYIHDFERAEVAIFVLLAVLFSIVFLTATILTRTVQNRIQRTIEGAVRMARQVASGNYSPVVEEGLRDDFASLFSDIQSMAESIQKKVEQLKDQNSDLQRFAFIAAHNLQEPVNKIVAYADLLLVEEQQYLSSFACREVKKIINSGEKLRGLVKDLMYFVEVVNAERPTGLVNLNAVLKDVLERILKGEIEEASAHVEKENLPWVQGNPKHFEIIFKNIIKNSLDFRSQDRLCRIKISSEKVSNSAYAFCIEDDGIGFDPNLASKIGEPFIKIVHKGRPSSNGTGLAVCSRILKLYDSRLSFSSGTDGGTKVLFIISSEARQRPHEPGYIFGEKDPQLL